MLGVMEAMKMELSADGAVRRHRRRGRRRRPGRRSRSGRRCSTWNRAPRPSRREARMTRDPAARSCPSRACPSGSRSTRSAPATACRTRRPWCPTEVKAEFVRRLLAAGLPDRRGDQLRAPAVGAAAGRRRRADDRAARRPGDAAARPAGAGAQRARPRPGARAGAAPRRDLRLRHRDLRPAQPQPQPGRAVRDVRADRAPGPRRRAGRPRLRLDVLRRPVGGRGAASSRSSRSAGGSRPRRQPAQPRRHHRRRHRRPRARAGRRRSPTPGRPPTSWPCTSTTPTARRWPTPRPALRAGVTTFDASAGGLGGCPYAEERHRQPGHRGPGLDAARARASSTAST